MRASATTLAPEMVESELALLLSTLRAANLDGRHLEIGTAAGGTLRELMAAYPDNKRPPFVVIDTMTYFPHQREIVERNLRAGGIDPGEVDFRVGQSWRLLREAAPEEKFSFIFIDGDHSAIGVTRDLAWSRFLDTNGVLAIHDYSTKFPGVIWAVDRFLRKHRNYEKVEQLGCLVIVRKQSPSKVREVNTMDLTAATLAKPLLRLSRSIKRRMKIHAQSAA